MKNKMIVSQCIMALLFFTVLLPPINASSTAWCESCSQVVIANEGIFAYNGSDFIDLTWHLKTGITDPSDLREFISNVEVVTLGNLVLVYSNYHDSIYMGIYNGSVPIKMSPVVEWYSWGPKDIIVYNGSIFFVAESGGGPHYASDVVFQLDPQTLKVEKKWDLAWDAREAIAPDNAGNTPYAWVNLGLDKKGMLWAKVDMIFPNTTLYYLYNGTDFIMTNKTPKIHPYTAPYGTFKIEINRGLMYHLPTFYSLYVPTRYILVENKRRKDVTDEIKRLARSVEPLYPIMGFWDESRGEWIVTYLLYGLPLAYRVNKTCATPLDIDYLPLASYLGDYVVLGNGTLRWKYYTVKIPTIRQSGDTYYPWQEGYVSLELYQKNGHPVIALPWEVRQNESRRSKKGYLAYEVTEKGFLILNTTDERKLGKNLIPPRVSMGKWNNIPGVLIVSIPNKTAFLITENGKIPVNFTIAKRTSHVVVGNDTFLFMTYHEAYVLPPWMEPTNVNKILEQSRKLNWECPKEKEDEWIKKVTPFAGVIIIAVFITLLIFLEKRK